MQFPTVEEQLVAQWERQAAEDSDEEQHGGPSQLHKETRSTTCSRTHEAERQNILAEILAASPVEIAQILIKNGFCSENPAAGTCACQSPEVGATWRATKTWHLRPNVGQKEPPRLGSTISYGEELAGKSHQDLAARFVRMARTAHSAMASRWSGGRVSMGTSGHDRRVRSRIGKWRTPGQWTRMVVKRRARRLKRQTIPRQMQRISVVAAFKAAGNLAHFCSRTVRHVLY